MSKQTNQPQIIRCKVCNGKAPNNLKVCPYCGSNLAPKPFPFLAWGLSIAVILGAFFIYTNLQPVVPQVQEQVEEQSQEIAAIINPPTETPTPTNTPTPTLEPTATNTPTPTNTPTETPTPTPTNTNTPIPTNTATVTNTPVPLPTNTPTNTPTPTPRFNEISLLGPRDGASFGRAQELMLRWETDESLSGDEHYAVRLEWQETQDGVTSTGIGGHNTTENSWIVPPERYFLEADSENGNRTFTWYVYVETEDGERLSPNSPKRTFIWKD